VLYGEGTVAARFALPGGIAETLVGVTAPLAGFWIGAGTPRRRVALALWHALSLAALLYLMGTGMTLRLAGDRLVDHMARFPLFLLPLFAIPLTLAAHILTLAALALRRKR
jgi:hypothetical protein